MNPKVRSPLDAQQRHTRRRLTSFTASSAQLKPHTICRSFTRLTLPARALSPNRCGRNHRVPGLTPNEPELKLPPGKPVGHSTPRPCGHNTRAAQPKPLDPRALSSEALRPAHTQPKLCRARHSRLATGPSREPPTEVRGTHQDQCCLPILLFGEYSPRDQTAAPRAVRPRRPRGDSVVRQCWPNPVPRPVNLHRDHSK